MEGLEKIIEEFDTNVDSSINLNFINKTTKLGKLATKSKASVKLSKDNKVYFKSPLLITRIIIEYTSAVPDVEIKWVDYNKREGSAIEEVKKRTVNTRTYRINKFITQLDLKVLHTFFVNKKVSTINIYGYSEDALDQLESKIDEKTEVINEFLGLANEKMGNLTNSIERLENLKIEHEEMKSDYEELEQELSSLAEKKDELHSEISNSNNTLDSKLKEISVRDGELADIKDSIKVKRKELGEVKFEKQETESKLREIESNKNLYSDEFISFRTEAKSNIIQYTLIILLCITIIGVLAVRMYFIAEHLFTNNLSILEALSLFVSRVPYTVIAGVIIYICARIVRNFVDKIIEINNRIMQLSQLLIIAKDVSDSQNNELQLTEGQKSDKRIYLKMELLKAYLRNSLGNDYEYKKKEEKVKEIEIENKKMSEDLSDDE